MPLISAPARRLSGFVGADLLPAYGKDGRRLGRKSRGLPEVRSPDEGLGVEYVGYLMRCESCVCELY